MVVTHNLIPSHPTRTFDFPHVLLTTTAMSTSDYVLLESADGYTFVVPRKIACASGMLKSMLDEEGNSFLSLHFGKAKSVCSCF
jgi:hypothetical protein